ncbi:hypothetical protein L3N51_00497 [Metallosphaera sp. J1]|uniref:DUF429 domain-containing protein n=1 Tax=Metallosphaera javensis (ex Hofmann et al. 2022) TaxID=99938 RepID=UPI001EDCDACD|nr:DUF429 domain-containing protein [Metallosphaera javensis (ex Hofmann et al. 2022)]MCG3108216.1 hypothetical protein [Metallosphaera javensis (ex Hofmann et al. 2022)]
MECGVDLAVKRKSAVAVMDGDMITVTFIDSDDEIVDMCKGASVVAVDAPLTTAKGFREVDRLFLSRGLRVFPPSFISSLTERGIRLSRRLRAIETHPTSSLKLLGWDWRAISGNKDEADAVVCALTANLWLRGRTLAFRASDGEIYLLQGDVPLPRRLGQGKYLVPDNSQEPFH